MVERKRRGGRCATVCSPRMAARGFHTLKASGCLGGVNELQDAQGVYMVVMTHVMPLCIMKARVCAKALCALWCVARRIRVVAAIGLRTHTLTCADNQIGAEGAKEIAQSLQVNSALSSLNLGSMFCCLQL